MRDIGQRLRRLLYVVPYVAKHSGGVLVDDLAHMLDISREHLLRDLDMLSQVGPPNGDPGEYLLVSVDDGRVQVHLPQRLTRPLRLTPAEGCSLLFGIRSLRESGVMPFDDAMSSAERKLLKALGHDAAAAEQLATDTLVAQPDRVASEHLRQLVTAARRRTRVVIEYVSASRSQAERRVLDPYGLVHHAGAWYVVGHCHTRGDTRTFRLERISALEVRDGDDQRFDIPDDFDLETYRREHLYVPSADAVTVTVHLEPLARARVGESWPVGEVRHLDDGGAEIAIDCEGFEWVTSWVLGFGQHAWIVGPADARAAMRARLDQLSRALAEVEVEVEVGLGPGEVCAERALSTAAAAATGESSETAMNDQYPTEHRPPDAPALAALTEWHEDASRLATDTQRMQGLMRGFPDRAAIAALVPAKDIRARRTRYFGDSVVIRMDALSELQREVVRDLYQFLQRLYGFIDSHTGDGHSDGEDAGLVALVDFCRQHTFSDLVARVSTLTAAMRDSASSGQLRRAFHDIRGGCFTSLVGYFDMIESGYKRPKVMDRLYSLCRDHLKIMRNVIPDLDPAGYQVDLQEKQHPVSLVREKWSSVAHQSGAQHAAVLIDCEFEGFVSDCCMEFAALDRVIYNLINNATEHASDDTVLMRVLAVDDDTDTQLRFAVINRVTEAQRERLDQRFGDDLGQLFEGGFTTDGHGLGLRICGDIVTDSYGLRSIDEARERGYIGARVIGDAFVAWFHWPAQRAQPQAAPGVRVDLA